MDVIKVKSIAVRQDGHRRHVRNELDGVQVHGLTASLTTSSSVDGDVVDPSLLHRLDKIDSRPGEYTCKSRPSHVHHAGSPEICVHSDLDADREAGSTAGLDRSHHVVHLLLLMHELSSKTVLAGPALRAAAVDVYAIAIWLDHLSRSHQVDGGICTKLHHQRSVLIICAEVCSNVR